MNRRNKSRRRRANLRFKQQLERFMSKPITPETSPFWLQSMYPLYYKDDEGYMVKVDRSPAYKKWLEFAMKQPSEPRTLSSIGKHSPLSPESRPQIES